MQHARTSLSPRHSLSIIRPSTRSRHGLRNYTSESTPDTPTTVNSEDGQRTLRRREHGHPSLPLPPLLDPLVVAAKEKYTRKKPLADEEAQTELQKQLAANPFAHALATPVRQCHHTGVRLPSYFLQPFSATLTPLDPPTPRPFQTAFVPALNGKLPPGTALSSSTYVLSKRRTIEQLKRKRAWARIADQRMQDVYARRVGKKAAKNISVDREWEWNEGMADVVGAQLSAEVVTLLMALLEGGEHFAVFGGTELMESKTAFDNAAAIFHVCRTDDSEADGLPLHVAYYRLTNLLSSEDCDVVLASGKMEEAYTVLEVHPATVQLRMAVYKLAIYHGIEPGSWRHGVVSIGRDARH